jgi:hypothetical protein
MARPAKKGLDYFPLDVDIFSDVKLKVVRGSFGNDGIILYLYLLCRIYKEGYYLSYDEDMTYVISADLGMSYEKIGQMLSFFLKRSLFDDKLFMADKVLTSVAIQQRYSEVTARNKVDKSKFWLLDGSENDDFKDSDEALKSAPQISVSDAKTPVSVAETPVNDEKMQQSKVNKIKVNESKVNESKVNESKVNEIKVNEIKVIESKVNALPQKGGTDNNTSTYGKNVHLTKVDYDALAEDYGERQVNEYIERVDRYIDEHGIKPYENHCSTIRSWLEKDGVSKKTEHSYDLDKIMSFAMEHVPVIDDSGRTVYQ